MTYTPDALTAEMQRLDYPVTKRRLIDWVQKGLLPHPQPRGLGRGRGKRYAWQEPDILHWAIDVFELLKWHRRANDVVLPLWALGYAMPLDRVRPELQRWADGLGIMIDQAIPVRGDRADLVSDLVSETESRFQDHPAAFLMPVLEALLHALVNPQTSQWSWIVDDLRAAIGADVHGLTEWPGEDRLVALVAVVREQFSADRLRTIVAEASDGELAQVQGNLHQCVQSARAVASFHPDLHQLALPYPIAALSVVAGIIDLAMRHAGYDAVVGRIVGGFVEGCRQVLADPRVRAEVQRLREQEGEVHGNR